MMARAFTFIWARYCKVRADAAHRRYQLWGDRARKYFSKLGVDQ